MPTTAAATHVGKLKSLLVKDVSFKIHTKCKQGIRTMRVGRIPAVCLHIGTNYFVIINNGRNQHQCATLFKWYVFPLLVTIFRGINFDMMFVSLHNVQLVVKFIQSVDAFIRRIVIV